jgi:hypothetical protein
MASSGSFAVQILQNTLACMVCATFVSACGGKSNSDSVATESAPKQNSPPKGPSAIRLTCDASLIGGYGGGSGTVADPYAICSIQHWNFFAGDSASWTKNFILFSDLDFTGVSFANFRMVGDLTHPFSGKFDGNGYKIKSLTLNTGTTSFGLFANTDGAATILNLTLKDINITSGGRIGTLALDHGSAGTLTLTNITANNLILNFNGTGSYNDNCGGLVGKVGSSIVADHINLSNITLNVNDLVRYFGGLVGTLGSLTVIGSGSATISNLVADSILVPYIIGISHQTAGGLIGRSWVPLNVSDVNMAAVDIDLSFSPYLGGIVGQMNNQIQFLRVRVAGSLKGTNVGGLVGQNQNYSSGPYVVYSHSIVDSSFEGNLPTPGNGSGGLIQLISDNLTITRSHFKGDIQSWGSSLGGLVGYYDGGTLNITDSYATGNFVNTQGYVSGRVGGLAGTFAGTANVVRSYFSGTVTGFGIACIGYITGATVSMSDTYYDSTLCTVNASSTGPIAGVTGLPTGTMQTATPFTNWLPSVWNFGAGRNPKQAWEL